MARPPPKRRKLTSYNWDAPWAEHRATFVDRSQALAQPAESLEEAHLLEPAAIESRRMLSRRQGTADSAIPSATATILASPSSTSFRRTASMATSIPPDLVLSMSIFLSLSGIPGVATELPASALSGILSGVSGALAPSDTLFVPSTSLPNDVPTITSTSNAPGNPASLSSAILEDDTPLIPSSLPLNDTASSTIISGDTASSSLVSPSTPIGFLTSIFSRNSTTAAAAKSTPPSSPSKTSDSSSPTSSSSTDSALFLVATLSQGDVASLSRSAEDYTTTLDGKILTILASPTMTRNDVASVPEPTSSSDLFSALSESGTPQTLTSTAITGTGADSSSSLPFSMGSASNSNSSSTPPAGTIAGGVVGGAAGLAVVVLIAMMALRWYRRQGMTQHHALPQGPVNLPDPNAPSPRGPSMAERAGLLPLAAGVTALFKHQSQNTEGGGAAEQGFTRVSGRKIPSAFSGGLTIQPPSVLSAHRKTDLDFNSASAYRNRNGFYGGSGTPSPSPPTGSIPLRSNSPEHMMLSPGPQRTPKLHAGGPYNMSPGGARPFSPAGNLARSDAPSLLDPSRNSRFSEGL